MDDSSSTSELSSSKPESLPKFLQIPELSSEYETLLASLPSETNWFGHKCYQHQGFWFDNRQLVSTLSCQEHFQAYDTDILLVSSPKAGTTWLKALAFAVLRRSQFPTMKLHPLLTNNPHDLVPYVEFEYAESNSPDFHTAGHPRLLASHLPSASLPRSALETACKIVYVCRNPEDLLVSIWTFFQKVKGEGGSAISLDEAVTKFVNGVSVNGPYWDHVLGYWKKSQENPDKVLFLRYETMKEDPKGVVAKLGKFFGCPFSPEEEDSGLVDEIVKLCSFNTMRSLDVNKKGMQATTGVSNDAFFRRGEVGDAVNYLSPANAKSIDQCMVDKLAGSGLIL